MKESKISPNRRKRILNNPIPQNINKRVEKQKQKKNSPGEVLRMSIFGRKKTSEQLNPKNKRKYVSLQPKKMQKGGFLQKSSRKSVPKKSKFEEKTKLKNQCRVIC